MSRRKSITLLVFLILISTSGCVFPDLMNTDPFDTNTPVGTGVMIESFEAEYPNVYSGEEVRFILKVKNTGSIDVEKAYADFLGLDNTWQKISTGVECREITLLAADPEFGTTGGEHICAWKYKAPSVPIGLSVQSEAKVRFHYPYSSSTIKTITLLPREELKVLEEQGRGLPIETQSKTDSPISIDIETSSPVITYEETVEFPVIITVKNVGGGTPKKLIGDKYAVDISIDAGDMQLKPTCLKEQEIFLMGTTQQTISCRLIAKKPETGAVQKNIEVSSEYKYFIDNTAKITVYSPNQPTT